MLAEVAGGWAEWAPSGEWIAYLVPDGMRVMRPDGSGTRTIGRGGYAPGMDWSPDSEWVIALSYERNVLELIHVQSNTVLALPFSAARMAEPAWRP